MCWCNGEGEDKENREEGLKQGTQGCWHVLWAFLFFSYVISVPIWLALIFDEALAQHSPFSLFHPLLSLPLFLCLCSLLPCYRLLFSFHICFPIPWNFCLSYWYLCIFDTVADEMRDSGYISISHINMLFKAINKFKFFVIALKRDSYHINFCFLIA